MTMTEATTRSKTRRFRELIAEKKTTVVPGAFDCISAHLIELAGFDAVYMTGGGTSASLTGLPDLGFLSMTEMADHAGNIARSVAVPVLADGDTGYGGVLNVIRTVQSYERGGCAGIQLEDQALPKRCGHVSGKRLVPTEDFVASIRAATDARIDPDFVIVARTDAREPEGLESAIKRSAAYVAAGADMVFVEAPRSRDELARIRDAVDAPLMVNMIPDSATPLLMPDELTRLGVELAIYPGICLGGAFRGIQESLGRLRDGTLSGGPQGEPSLMDILELCNFSSWSAQQASYLGDQESTPMSEQR
jgi:carboxyvinyl-carboxyphosphonate phosphorylmutase